MHEPPPAPATTSALLAHPTLTVVEAAQVLKISRNTCYDAIRAGQIPAIRLGKDRIVVPTAKLRALLGMDDEVTP